MRLQGNVVVRGEFQGKVKVGEESERWVSYYKFMWSDGKEVNFQQEPWWGGVEVM